MKRRSLYAGLKRGIDFTGAALALILLAPVLLGIAVVIWLNMGKPVLFSQMRPGLAGRPFKMWKFRTMTDERDARGNLLPDEARLRRAGQWLRRSSLDELPELFNVLRGDMSFVGPRPLLMQYLPLYDEQQSRRHEVRPGITGWAQVNGRNSISWEQKFEHDVWYVDHMSLFLDAKILLMTVWNVIAMRGINEPGQATAKAFEGTPKR